MEETGGKDGDGRILEGRRERRSGKGRRRKGETEKKWVRKDSGKGETRERMKAGEVEDGRSEGCREGEGWMIGMG